jgi:hypothetical protein
MAEPCAATLDGDRHGPNAEMQQHQSAQTRSIVTDLERDDVIETVGLATIRQPYTHNRHPGGIVRRSGHTSDR